MPPKSIFQFPDKSARDETLSKNTRAVYRSKINSIAKLTGYTTVRELLDHPKEVIEVIEKLVPADDKNVKSLRRILLSALMYVLYDVPYEERTEYYEYYLTQKDPWTAPTGDEIG